MSNDPLKASLMADDACRTVSLTVSGALDTSDFTASTVPEMVSAADCTVPTTWLSRALTFSDSDSRVCAISCSIWSGVLSAPWVTWSAT